MTNEDTHSIDLREVVGPWDFNEREYLPSLKWTQKLNFAAVMASLPLKTLWWTVRYMLPGLRNRVGIKRFLVNRIVAYVMNSVSLSELRVLMPVVPLRVQLKSRALRKYETELSNYNHFFEVDNASARWISEVADRQRNDPVILYLHGGAYFLKTMPEQVTWLARTVKALPQHRLSVLELDYTVSPQGQYPVQLHEALRVYEKLAESCSRIVVLGDSAGGNLAAALCAHITKNKVPVPQPFGVVLISPWTELENTGGSMTENKEFDYLNFDKIDRFAMYYAGSKDKMKDPYINQWRGGKEFWQNVFPQRTLCVWGDKELLRDGCHRFTEMAGIKQTYEEPGGVHDAMIVGFRSPSTKVVLDHLDHWLSGPSRPAPPIPVRNKL